MKFIKNQMVASTATGKRYQVVRDTSDSDEFVEVYAIVVNKMVTTLAPISAVVVVNEG